LTTTQIAAKLFFVNANGHCPIKRLISFFTLNLSSWERQFNEIDWAASKFCEIYLLHFARSFLHGKEVPKLLFRRKAKRAQFH
jgi:hypothetical protein